MSRRFVAAVLAASLTVTAFAPAPARAADQDDIARLLFGAAALVVIGKAIQDSRKKDKPRATPAPPDHALPLTVPPRCLRTLETRDGLLRYIDRDCAWRAVPRPRRLPEACLDRYRSYRGTELGYGARCMRARGWRLERG